ncbi:MAG: hypothetical protein PHW75_01585 [Patescibacteria group bacterium]|nr:hypothetical protein [Patescibacteria group bacterium]
MSTKPEIRVLKKLLEEIAEPDGRLDFYPIAMASVVNDPDYRFVFVTFKKSLPEVQDFYLLLLNDVMQNYIRSAREEIKDKIKDFNQNAKGLEIPDSLFPVEEVKPHKLVTLFESIEFGEIFESEFKKNDDRDVDLFKILDQYAIKICRKFDLEEKYVTPLNLYILTGYVCAPSGIEVRITPERDNLKLIMDKNVTKNTLLKHWEHIEGIRKIMPRGIRRRGFSYLDKFSEYYTQYKNGVSINKIAEGTPYSETDMRRILNRMDKRTKNK